MAVDEKVVEQKIANKEPLSKEETAFVMSYPNAEGGNTSGDQEIPDEELGFEPEKKDDKATPGTKDEAGKSAADQEAENAKADEAKKKADKEKADADAKAAEAAAAEKKKKEAEEGIYQKVEKELEKPEGQEDLSGLSEREKGLYYALKAERKKRQKAEEDRDEVLFRDVKARKAAEAKAAIEKEAPEPDIDVKIDGEDEDFITVKDAKKIIDAVKKARPKSKAEAGEVDEVAAQNRTTALRIANMSARDVVESRVAGGQKDLPDYDTTMKIGEMIVESNLEYQKEIYKAYKEGRNPALVTYDLVRKDPKFATLYGKKDEKAPEPKAEDKAKEGKENLKKIEENEKKPKTSGAQGAGSTEGTGEYTLESLLAMSPREFRKVPKHIREKFLYNT